MILLDENIPREHFGTLRGWRLQPRQIAYEIASEGIQDQEIIPLLHRLRRPTLFTRDLRLYRPQLCHHGYCIVCMAVHEDASATYVRRTLKRPALNTQAKRMGKIIYATADRIRMRIIKAQSEVMLEWPD